MNAGVARDRTQNDGGVEVEAGPLPSRSASTWRINHSADAGGPTYVEVMPSASARAAFLRIGVTITELRDVTGAPSSGAADRGPGRSPEMDFILQERVRTAHVLLSTLESLEHFADEPHWRRQIRNIDELVRDIAAYIGRPG